MFNRWLGITTAVLMVIANSALLSRDLLSHWLAGAPPRPAAFDLGPNEERIFQVGLFDEQGERLGYAWTHAHRSSEVVIVRSTTVLAPISRASITLPRLRLDMTLHYVEGERLESLNMSVNGLGIGVELRGSYVPPNEFPCAWQFGDQRGTLVIPADSTRSLGEAMRPFGSLTDLHVGQTWRHEMINPLVGLTSSFGSEAQATTSILVRVTGQENIEFNGGGVRAFVVESEGVKAWVTPLGDVIRQEIDVPLFGRIIAERENYDPRLDRQTIYKTYRQ